MLKRLLEQIRHEPLLWLLAFVPVVSAAEHLAPEIDLARYCSRWT